MTHHYAESNHKSCSVKPALSPVNGKVMPLCQPMRFNLLPASLTSTLQATTDLLQGVDYHYVQKCLTVFRQFTKNFPFVMVDPDADAASMAAERPITTVALCAVASGSHPDIQVRLVRSFRLALSRMVVLQGERSIDLSIGLLIFLAWNHHYMAKHQIYQELCLLAGMATDMGMYGENLASNDPTTPSVTERFRTYLGCYYLCCSLSTMGFNKPNPLRWTDNLRKYAEIVGQSSGIQSDRMLVGIIELVKSIDDFEDAMQIHGIENLTVSMQYVIMQTKAANNRLSTLKRDHPEIAGMLAFNAVSIHICHRLIRITRVSDTGNLIQCAVTIKEYTDDLLARPATTLHQIAIVDWINLLEVMLLMARLTTRVPANGNWEAGAISSILQPDVILDRVYAHMASAPSEDILNPRDEVQLLWLQNVCETIKTRILGRDVVRQRADVQFDPVHSLGSNEISPHLEGRFRPVNEPSLPPAPQPHKASTNQGTSEVLGFSDHGILDEPIWKTFVVG